VSPQPASAAQRALLIRVAMAVGVATFFVVAWFISRSATAPVVAEAKLRTLSTAMYVAVGLAAAAIMALRLRIAEAAPAMRVSLSVVAWAVGEFAAIFGGVMLFVTGDWRLALPGALVFAMSLVVVRMPE
jgi:hypothetical protein